MTSQKIQKPQEKSTLKLIITTIIVIVIIGTGYLGYKAFIQKGYEPLRPEDLTELETYRNDEFGFSIDYPKEWTITEIPIRDAEDEYYDDLDSFRYTLTSVEFKPSEPHISPSMSIEIYDNPNNLSPREWLEPFMGTFSSNMILKDIYISGIPAVKGEMIIKRAEYFKSSVIMSKTKKALGLGFLYIPKREIVGKGVSASPKEWKKFWDQLLNTFVLY